MRAVDYSNVDLSLLTPAEQARALEAIARFHGESVRCPFVPIEPAPPADAGWWYRIIFTLGVGPGYLWGRVLGMFK